VNDKLMDGMALQTSHSYLYGRQRTVSKALNQGCIGK
jgi:hypothetical protein